jgi:hypothetical protein
MQAPYCPFHPTFEQFESSLQFKSVIRSGLTRLMTRKQRRLVLIGSAMAVLAVAVALMLNALRGSIVFFNSPSDVVEKHVPAGTRIRLGGLVKNRHCGARQ